jgi:hypothetical protein
MESIRVQTWTAPATATDPTEPVKLDETLRGRI